LWAKKEPRVKARASLGIKARASPGIKARGSSGVKARKSVGIKARRSPGVTSHTLVSVRSAREYEGVNLHTPKATPTLGDEVPVDF
jgi:hypothetical protein